MITKEAIEAGVAAFESAFNGSPNSTEMVTTILTAALAAMPGPAVKVKPLEWVLSWGPDEEGDECHVAGTPFGSFAVERLDGRWMWRYCFDEYYDEDHFECEGLEAGKVASQALWNSRISPLIEERILSALTPAPDLQAENERLRKALEFVQLWAWRDDPPNAARNLSDSERLSAIKYHPSIAAAIRAAMEKEE